jgi:cytoskeletal protein RodZ
MRDYEKLVVGALLAVPVIVAVVGWPLFVHWVGGTPTTPQPEVAGAAATSVATARAERTPRPPTPGLPATPNPATAAPAAQAAPAAPAAAGGTSTRSDPQPDTPQGPAPSDPGAAVASFYQMVGAHDFGRAAQLWSPRMRAAYPPDQNIDQRFSQTRQVAVNRAEVVSMNGTQATVAVDLTEVTGARQQHYTGTWSLVRSGTGWLLDQPNLQSAP